MHRAGATLGKSTAKMRIVQTNVVAQRIEQWHVRIGVDAVALAVDIEGKFLAHDRSVLPMTSARRDGGTDSAGQARGGCVLAHAACCKLSPPIGGWEPHSTAILLEAELGRATANRITVRNSCD